MPRAPKAVPALSGRGNVLIVRLPGEEPVNPTGTGGELDQVTEVFLFRGKNVLQPDQFSAG